jgi:hypothetical protein
VVCATENEAAAHVSASETRKDDVREYMKRILLRA